jgi:hypothetical protein
MNQRFTLDGSEALEHHLSDLCSQICTRVQDLIPSSQLDGIVLGGGYGRGEGGVLRTESGDQPYNDLEFFVFVRGVLGEIHFADSLHALGHELSDGAGVEIEFKVMTLAKLRHAAPSMFYYDLVTGHRWIVGDDSLFEGCAHHRDPVRIPLHEATRLLMNRCSGLLYAKERLLRAEFTDADADFVARNIAKAQLALGDVVLAVHGRYHWSCRERGHRLLGLDTTLAGVEQLRAFHTEGIQFKLHPQQSRESRDVLLARHGQVAALAQHLWLWLEARRLKHSFDSPASYALSDESKCPEQPFWRNLAVNLRAFGPRLAFTRNALRYPRERLLRALPLLLWGVTSIAEQAMVRSCLQCDALNLSDAVSAYSKLWQRFN